MCTCVYSNTMLAYSNQIISKTNTYMYTQLIRYRYQHRFKKKITDFFSLVTKGQTVKIFQKGYIY